MPRKQVGEVRVLAARKGVRHPVVGWIVAVTAAVVAAAVVVVRVVSLFLDRSGEIPEIRFRGNTLGTWCDRNAQGTAAGGCCFVW